MRRIDERLAVLRVGQADNTYATWDLSWCRSALEVAYISGGLFSTVLCRILRLSEESLASPHGGANAFWRFARPARDCNKQRLRGGTVGTIRAVAGRIRRIRSAFVGLWS